MACFIVPPYLLRRIAQLDDPRFARAAAAAQASLVLERPYVAPVARSSLRARSLEPVSRTISSAGNTSTLPGTLLEEPFDDAAQEAWDGLGQTHDLFAQVFERASIDDENLRLDATVHYERNYDNAFWNGERMVFGDGDNEIFRRMTASVSVIGHELTHGVTQYTAGLEYQGQSGALNESMSDVFGALVEQYALSQTAADASWLIGFGLFTDEVEGSAIRSLKAPGTAYDDDVLGKDPQPDHMDGYIETRDDNGGVHLNSGIPNRAFYLTAAAIGGNAWERAGRIWYSTLTGGLSSTSSFSDFAARTTDAAESLFGAASEEVTAVASAWQTVGVSS
jgi:Zn-dependent metalloprotease